MVMKLLKQNKIIIKKSKFFGYFLEIKSQEELNEAICFVQDNNTKATHICYGAIFDDNEIFKNDSEVGNPGKGLLEILKQKKFKNNALVIARYFGGINLGPAGVGKAFRECGNDLIRF